MEVSPHTSSSSPLREVAGTFPLRLISCRTAFATSTKEDSVVFGIMILASTNDSAAKKVISRSKNRNVSIRGQIFIRPCMKTGPTNKILFTKRGNDVETKSGGVDACSHDSECGL